MNPVDTLLKDTADSVALWLEDFRACDWSDSCAELLLKLTSLRDDLTLACQDMIQLEADGEFEAAEYERAQCERADARIDESE